MLHYVMFVDNAQTSCVRIMGVGTMPLRYLLYKLCVYVDLCTCECRYPWCPKEGAGSPGSVISCWMWKLGIELGFSQEQNLLLMDVSSHIIF